MIDTQHITGLVLAGGRGSRMGGIDKGLVLYRGEPLVRHALARLAPRVGVVAINANRNLGVYETMGVPVWPDAVVIDAAAGAEVSAREEFAGPLAGLLAGLTRCATPYLATVPCDSPRFPLDLVMRLAEALEQADADVAMASTRVSGGQRQQPVFCMMKASVRDGLSRFLQSGQRKLGAWGALQRRVDVVFDDADAFANANTADDLQRLESLA